MDKVQLCSNDTIDHQLLLFEWSSPDPFPIKPLYHFIWGPWSAHVQQVPRLAVSLRQTFQNRVEGLAAGPQDTVPAQHVNSSRDQAFHTAHIPHALLGGGCALASLLHHKARVTHGL